MPPSLSKMFTIAAPEGEDGNTELIFSNGSNEPFTLDEMHAIVRDPVCKSVMGDFGILCPVEGHGGDLLLYTHDIEGHAIDRMDTISAEQTLLMHTPEKGIEKVNLQEEYYKCTLPHRTIVGCKGCLNRDTRTACRVKEIGGMSDDTETALCPEQIIDEQILKSRKSVIAGYTYVGPRLTAITEFAKTYRPMDEHDFSEVENRSAIIQQGLRERGRRRRFDKVACSVCLVQEDCKRSCEDYQRKHCSGPYVMNEKESVAHVLAKTDIPFNKYQLLFLALNSGELDTRYNRCKYWATFRMSGNTLAFGLCRLTTGEFERIHTFEEAKEILCKCIKHIQIPRKGFRYLTPQTTAVLIELAHHHYSPKSVSRWRTRYYDALGITYNPYQQALTLSFKYNSGGGGWYKGSGWELAWHVEAYNLSDVFGEYTELATLHRSTHPDSYRKTHNG